jgi:hypothetical protein
MPQTTCTCGAKLEYGDAHAGKKIRCPRCQAIVEAPRPEPASEGILTAELIPSGPAERQAFQAGKPGRSVPAFPGDDRGYPQPMQPTQASGKAIWSLILSFPTLFFSLITAIPSIVLGILAIRDCNRNPRLGGSGLAIAGIVLSGVLTLLNGFILLLLVPSVSNVRASAARMQEMNNLKQLGLAVHSYNDVFQKMPAAYAVRNPIDQQEHSMFFHLLPFIEQQGVFQQPGLVPKNANDRGSVVIPTFLSPHEEKTNPTGRVNFAGNLRVFSNVGATTMLGQPVPLAATMDNQLSVQRIQDGSSNTAMFATRFGECGNPLVSTLFDGIRPNAAGSPFFGAGVHNIAADDVAAADRTFQLMPTAANCQPNASVYGHAFVRQGLAVAICDGSVRSISPTITPQNFQAFLCPSDGLIVDLGN